MGAFPDIPDRFFANPGEAFMAMDVMARYSVPATDRAGNAHGVAVERRIGICCLRRAGQSQKSRPC